MLTLSGCVIKRNDIQEWLHVILKLMSVKKNKNIGKQYYVGGICTSVAKIDKSSITDPEYAYADSLKVVLNEFSLQAIVIVGLSFFF